MLILHLIVQNHQRLTECERLYSPGVSSSHPEVICMKGKIIICCLYDYIQVHTESKILAFEILKYFCTIWHIT